MTTEDPHREPNKHDLEEVEANRFLVDNEWEEEHAPYTEWDAGDDEYDRRRDEQMAERYREREA